MRAQWIVGGFLVAGCVDSVPVDEPHDFDLRFGVIEANDYFGSQMVAGDFNGDGKMDLAVAAVGEGVFGHPEAGAIFIYKGTANGLVPWQVFTENAFATATINDYDLFGYSLAAREMTGDNAWELVVGAPGYWVNGKQAAGAVFTFKGSSNGLIAGSLVTENNAAATPEAGDMFGLAVAMGSYDGVDNMVAVGAPGEKIGSNPNRTGWVSIMSWLGDSLLEGTYSLAPPSDATNGALFGNALLTMNYNGDAYDDLIVGAPLDGTGGVVRTYRGRASGNVVLDQRLGAPEYEGQFGAVLATGRFHNAGKPELAISAPQDPGDQTFPGAVYIYVPSASNVFGRWDTLRPGSAIATEVTFGVALAAGDLDGDGSDELAVGVPYYDHGTDKFGQVQVFQGTASTYNPMPLWGTRSVHAESYGTGYGAYGSSIVIADFDRTTPHHPDMAVGVPSASVNGISFAGLVDAYAGGGGIPTYVNTLTEGN
jgi:hypothetical protein